MKTHHRSACCIIAWTLVFATAVHAQNSSSHLASNSRSYNPAYGQVGPAGYQAPSNRGQYYTPDEYLPTPGSRPAQTSQPSAASSQAHGLSQGPYAYPSAPAAKAPAPAGRPAEDLEALRRENQLLNERLRADQAQDIRGYLSPPSQLSYVNHMVRRGDTLWGLAIKYKTSSNAITQANNLPKGKLLRGATIRIPVMSKAAAPAPRPTYYAPLPPQPYEIAGASTHGKSAVAPSPKPEIKSGSHIVKSGETLGILAQHYGVSLTELKTANQLRSAHRIYVGQRLVIPGRSDAEVAELSKKTIPTAAPAPSRAQLPPYAYPGKAQTYKPIAAASPSPKTSTAKPTPAASAPAATKTAPSTSNRGVTSYRIMDGDTLETVAADYKISPTELRDFNRLTPGQFPPAGRTLLVPTPAIVSL